MKNEEQEKTPAIAEIKERVQFAEWQRQIEERQSEGLGVAAWCEQQGISKSVKNAPPAPLARRNRATLNGGVSHLPKNMV